MQILDELDETELPEKSKRFSIIDRLKEKNYLAYGITIPESEFKNILQLPDSINEEDYLLAKLQLRSIIRSEGFFCTTRGHHGDMYILTTQEMPNHNEKKNKSVFRELQLRQRCLNMINPIDCSVDERKKLEFEILRNGALEIQMHDSLKKRCRFD